MKIDDFKKLSLFFKAIGMYTAFPDLAKKLVNHYEKQEIKRLKKLEYERL